MQQVLAAHEMPELCALHDGRVGLFFACYVPRAVPLNVPPSTAVFNQ